MSFTTTSIYEYDENGGDGVDVYVIDTGININHVEFEGRASWGTTIPVNDTDEDENGHGTHVAGTIASRKYGVAKKAHVIAVKVLQSNGKGTLSDVLGGIVWAVNAAKAKADSRADNHKGSVANMSLGSRIKSLALNEAINKGVESGLHFAVAAGMLPSSFFGLRCLTFHRHQGMITLTLARPRQLAQRALLPSALLLSMMDALPSPTSDPASIFSLLVRISSRPTKGATLLAAH